MLCCCLDIFLVSFVFLPPFTLLFLLLSKKPPAPPQKVFITDDDPDDLFATEDDSFLDSQTEQLVDEYEVDDSPNPLFGADSFGTDPLLTVAPAPTQNNVQQSHSYSSPTNHFSPISQRNQSRPPLNDRSKPQPPPPVESRPISHTASAPTNQVVATSVKTATRPLLFKKFATTKKYVPDVRFEFADDLFSSNPAVASYGAGSSTRRLAKVTPISRGPLKTSTDPPKPDIIGDSPL